MFMFSVCEGRTALQYGKHRCIEFLFYIAAVLDQQGSASLEIKQRGGEKEQSKVSEGSSFHLG